MREGTASVTAQRVAAARAGLARTSTPAGDPDADDRLAADVAGGTGPPRPGLVSYIAARTRFFDEELLAAMAGGIGQVVVAGAGYDGRALRFRSPAVRFFELDHPATQSDKHQRLTRLAIPCDGITFVAADFSHDEVAAALSASGLNRSSPTFFMCEGVLRYLWGSDVDRLFAALRSVAAPGSRFALSSGQAPDNPAYRRRLAAIGEPARSSLTTEEACHRLAAAGWTPERTVETGRAALIRSGVAVQV